MKRRALYFTAPKRVETREEEFEWPQDGKALVRTFVSALSAGTEMLFYRNEVPGGLPVDPAIKGLSGEFAYPVKYGYAAVGEIVDTGAGVDRALIGSPVFSLAPHEDLFDAFPEDLVFLPKTLTSQDAVFLPFMDTAITMLLDGAPLIGERAVVFGQGVIGLLVTALLARFPLARLVTLDRHELRRNVSVRLGATASLDPAAPGASGALLGLLESGGYPCGADVSFELSGDPALLSEAVAAACFSGRVVIGSWYGKKKAEVDLGGRFHRDRITLVSSQVSTIAPRLSGAWTKCRRAGAALRMIENLRPSSLVTHRFPLERAGEAYALIDSDPGETLQVVLTYER